MARPNLLLCFDAFGTLIRPVRPVTQQYAEVARQCGVSNFSDDELHISLLAAMKSESKLNPNYGKATGLGATRWWTNVIHNTFTPFVKNGGIPSDLAPKLLHRFTSADGYDVEPGLLSTLKALKQPNPQRPFDRLVVGVITNSDDRVPSVLSSLGLDVSPLRYGAEVDPARLARKGYDIDFHCMSYDVGVEKPDRRIFEAAELMLARVLASQDAEPLPAAEAEVRTWRKVYVGDEYAKDVVGSVGAGWNAVLLDPEGEHTSPDITELENSQPKSIEDAFRNRDAVRVPSINSIVTWLSGGVSSAA